MGQSIVIDFIAKTNKAIGDVNKLNRAVGSNATTAQKVGAGIKRAALPATAALVALGAGAKVAVDAAADMNEALSKTEVLFGEAAGDVKEWSKTTAKAFGVSRQSALEAAGTFATFGKSAGLTGKKLGTFSKDFTELAADMASFSNTSPEEAIEAIGAALRGESEPIRKYGVLLDDATLRNEALKLGLIKTTKEALTPQQKVLAAQKAILKQTSDAQGDYSRTSDSLSNRQKALTAQIDDLKASLGQALVPVMQVVIGLFQRMAEWVKNNETVAKILIGTIAVLAAGIVAANVAMKAYTVAANAAKVAQIALNIAMRANPIGIVLTALALLAASIYTAWKRSSTFRDAVKSVWDWIKKMASAFEGPAKAAIAVLSLAFQTLMTPINAVIAGIEKAIALWNKIKGAIQGKGGNPFGPGGVYRPPGSKALFQNTAPATRSTRATATEEATATGGLVVNDELLARALQRLILHSDARNGRALYV